MAGRPTSNGSTPAATSRAADRGTMSERHAGRVEALQFGFDAEQLLLAAGCQRRPGSRAMGRHRLAADRSSSSRQGFELLVVRPASREPIAQLFQHDVPVSGAAMQAAADAILELGIPWRSLAVEPDDQVHWNVELIRGEEVDRAECRRKGRSRRLSLRPILNWSCGRCRPRRRGRSFFGPRLSVNLCRRPKELPTSSTPLHIRSTRLLIWTTRPRHRHLFFLGSLVFSSFVEYWAHRILHQWRAVGKTHRDHHARNEGQGVFWEYLDYVKPSVRADDSAVLRVAAGGNRLFHRQQFVRASSRPIPISCSMRIRPPASGCRCRLTTFTTRSTCGTTISA